MFPGPVKVNISVAVLSVSPSQLHYRSYEGMRQEQSFEKVDPFTVRKHHTFNTSIFPYTKKYISALLL